MYSSVNKKHNQLHRPSSTDFTGNNTAAVNKVLFQEHKYVVCLVMLEKDNDVQGYWNCSILYYGYFLSILSMFD